MSSSGGGGGGRAGSEAHRRAASPLERANCCSRLTFVWAGSFLRLVPDGDGAQLNESDLPHQPHNESAVRLTHEISAEWQREVERRGEQRASLWRAMRRAWGWRYCLWVLPVVLLQRTAAMLQVIALGGLIEWFAATSDGSPEAVGNHTAAAPSLLPAALEGEESWRGWMLAGCFACFGAIIAFCHHALFFTVWRWGMRIRVGLTGLIFRKAVRVSLGALAGTTQGAVTTLVSNDVEKFLKPSQFLPYLVVAPVEGAIILTILWQLLGPASLGGLYFFVLLLPLQFVFSRAFGDLRGRTAAETDERMRWMTQTVVGAAVMKVFAWEVPYVRLIREARAREISHVQTSSRARGVNAAVFRASVFIVSFIVLLIAYLLGEEVSASVVFVTLALLSNLSVTSTLFLPFAIEGLAEAKVTVRRMERFLRLEEMDKVRPARLPLTDAKQSDGAGASKTTPATERPNAASISVDALTCAWSATETVVNPAVAAQGATATGAATAELTLREVSFSVPAGSLTAIVGTVGSGKTSLLLSLMRELSPVSGGVAFSPADARIAFAAQSPWILSGSVRDNITFGAEFDRERYTRVVRSCALKPDFEQFADGDATLIGERGTNLSGGQRARIGLARAVYVDAEVYLLDDPLSAVDTRVGRQLFDMTIAGLLNGKTRILVTHQLQYLRSADQIVVMEGGRVRDVGTYDELVRRGIKLERYEEDVDEEERGSVAAPFSDVGDNALSVIDGAAAPGSVSVRSRRAKSRARSSSVASSSASALEAAAAEPGFLEPAEAAADGAGGGEDRAAGVVSWATYAAYARAAGGRGIFGAALLLCAIGEGVMISCGVYMAWWSRLSLDEQQETGALEGYVAVTIGALILSWARTRFFFFITVRASQVLHDDMLSRVVRAPISFFQQPQGRILNRFSKDLGFMDDVLPLVAYDFLDSLLAVLGRVLLVCISNPVVFLATAPLLYVFVRLRRYYMHSAREIKRIEAISRSPAFSLLSECLSGLETLRSFGVEAEMEERFQGSLDANTRAHFAFLATSRWLGFRLDSMCIVFLGFAAGLAVPFRGQISASVVGLSLSLALQLTALFQWTVRQSAEVENLAISVERVLAYTAIPTEDVVTEGSFEPPPGGPLDGWPSKGEIVLRSTTMRYRPGLDPVLRGIDATIHGGERIGVVGRTGAGKSSLILALFRLVECDDGTGITIDGVDTKNVPLQVLRSRIGIIPQDPILFRGTIRTNLDPFEVSSDDAMWSALRAVQLEDTVRRSGGLEAVVSEMGGNLSVGQRQLVCLARAVLGNKRILVLDEATASVDFETDALIQKTLRTVFKAATVIVVAHRLDTIIDSTRIMVLGDGKLREFAPPAVLLRDETSAFSELVAETGESTAAALRAAADRAHEGETEREDDEGKG